MASLAALPKPKGGKTFRVKRVSAALVSPHQIRPNSTSGKVGGTVGDGVGGKLPPWVVVEGAAVGDAVGLVEVVVGDAVPLLATAFRSAMLALQFSR